MTINPEIRERTRFFAENAGYSAPPGRYACALTLARAEAEANGRGFTVEWMHDPEADLSWADAETLRKIDNGTYGVLGCIVTDPDTDDVESLWGIVAAFEDPYMHVVEAELSAEILQRDERGKRAYWAARDVVTI